MWCLNVTGGNENRECLPDTLNSIRYKIFQEFSMFSQGSWKTAWTKLDLFQFKLAEITS